MKQYFFFAVLVMSFSNVGTAGTVSGKVDFTGTAPEPRQISMDADPVCAALQKKPFFSVTGEDGSFEIKDLPAGSYVIEAWHEKYGTQVQNVNVDETGFHTANFGISG